MQLRTSFSLLLTASVFLACSAPSTKNKPEAGRLVYMSDSLRITQISDHTYIHTSYLETNDFGRVPCNGMIVADGNEALVFDTPASLSASEALLNWISDSLRCEVRAIVPTHFHNDCLAGLDAFHRQGVASHGLNLTGILASGSGATPPTNLFADSLVLPVGSTSVLVRHFGAGHTADNVVAYFAREQVLFGGCLIKELNASKGYLGDAEVGAWPATVEHIQKAFPDVRQVIPGHGAHGGPELLDYTIALFRKNAD